MERKIQTDAAVTGFAVHLILQQHLHHVSEIHVAITVYQNKKKYYEKQLKLCIFFYGKINKFIQFKISTILSIMNKMYKMTCLLLRNQC